MEYLNEDEVKQINENFSTKYYFSSEQQQNMANEMMSENNTVQTTDLDDQDSGSMYFFRVTKFYLDPTFAHNNDINKPRNTIRVSY